MMAKRPEDRQPSMAAVVADLEACVARPTPPVQDPIPPPAPQPPAPPVAGKRSSSTDSELRAFLRSLGPACVATPPKATRAANETLARGAGGEIIGADERGIEAKLSTGKRESLAWPVVRPEAIGELIGLVSPADTPEDRLAAGVLSLASNDRTSAERHFDRARALGADVGPYLAPLAKAAFARVQAPLEAENYVEVESLLADVEARYGDTPWFACNRAAFDAVRAKAQAGIYEADAEKLYAEAAELFKMEQLFDAKPLCEELKTEYVDSRAATDTARKPSLADMEKAVAELGQFITVRQDGEGDFTTIQAAIDAAPPNSLVEIQDDGPYNEKINIQQERLTVRGKKGCWPIVTSVGPVTHFPRLVAVAAGGTLVERLVLAHGGPAGTDRACLTAYGHSARIRSCVLYMASGYAFKSYGPKVVIEQSVIAGAAGQINVALVVRDSLWLGTYGSRCHHLEWENVLVLSGFPMGGRSNLRSCTLCGPLRMAGARGTLVDCIVLSVDCAEPGASIDHCDVYGKTPFIELARPGKGCFSQDPQFVNPKALDYRLLPSSPCVGKASDGGDLGCRYTPEMIEMLTLALQLRQQGIIKF